MLHDFQVEYVTRLDGIWGTVPLNQTPANDSGLWGGIVADVLHKTHQVSISGWLNKYNRKASCLNLNLAAVFFLQIL